MPDCVRPGGHRPPHSDAEYVWDPQTDRKIFTEDASDYEELIPDGEEGKASEDEKAEEVKSLGFVRELNVEKKDFKEFKRDPDLAVSQDDGEV